MLTSATVTLAITIAKGLIKLRGRIDIVLAEKEAVQSDLAVVLPVEKVPPDANTMYDDLTFLLQSTKSEEPDPLGEDREKIEDALTNRHTDLFLSFVEKYLPERANIRFVDLNRDYMIKLKETHPEIAADPDLSMAAFYIGSGKDIRNKDYTWRLALTVVDVVTEFGAENVALFTRDEKVQSIVGSILKRFGDADLQTTDSTKDLLKVALSATLNGALDAKDSIQFGEKWIGSLFDALLSARDSMPEGKQDDFILGLLNGQGYPAFVSSLLTNGASLLDDNEENFQDIASTFLKKVADIVKENDSLEEFFDDHWGDILRAGFKSVAEHGSVIASDETPVLKQSIIAVAEKLAVTPNKEFLSSELIVGIIDATVSAAAANSDRIDEIINEDWIAALLNSVIATVSEEGVKNTFTKEGIQKLTIDTLETFAKNPELIIDDPGLAQELLGGILTSLSKADEFSAQELASAAVEGALTAISEHPELLKFKYAEVVSTLSARVGELVKEHSITKVQGQDVLRALTQSIADNPQVFIDFEAKLSSWALDAVAQASKDGEVTLLAGASFTAVLNELVKVLAKNGKAAIQNHPGVELMDPIENILLSTLEKAQEELGKNISNKEVPKIIAGMVEAWAKGELSDLDPTSGDFMEKFSELLDQAA